MRPVALMMLIAGASSAAPRERPPTPEADAVAARFARELGVVAQLVSREYVRPVETNDLYAVAVGALYSHVHRSRPVTLLADLRRAKDETARLDLVRQARAALHPADSLEAPRDLRVAVAAFTSVLDPHSVLLTNEELNGTSTALDYGFEFDGGSTPTVPFRVVSVKPGSPAQRAGLRPGDIVRKVDDVAADLRGRREALGKFEIGSPRLTVDRSGRREPLVIRIASAAFEPESVFGVVRNPDNSWDHWLDRDRGIAYVRLGAIEPDSAERLQDVLRETRGIRGLVFDVRWCPGGYIDAATQIASMFLDDGVIARMKYRNETRGGDGVVRADAGLVRTKAGDWPVLILMNGDTVGGGELISGALKDNGRAVLAGSRTFGKATIQWPLDVPGLPGHSFKLTGGLYTRANGKALQRQPDSKPTDDWGLRPDPGHEIPSSADLSRKLKQMHLDYVLRPGGSREAMDLDDPQADPQREQARKLMIKLIDR